MKSVSIIGAGRMGGALAIALSRAGVPVRQLVYRGERELSRIFEHCPKIQSVKGVEALDPNASDVVIIATGDAEISAAADELERLGVHGLTILHTSGALSSDVLSPLSASGNDVGSIHPLVSISNPIKGSTSFSGIGFCIEGQTKAVADALDLVEKLGGRSFEIPTELKPLYHASAVMSSGHVTALVDTAVEMLVKCGLTSDEALSVLGPLLASTVDNIRSQGTTDALTGSFARFDVEVIRKHLSLLAANGSNEALAIYRQLGERSTMIAERKHGSSERSGLVRGALSEHG
jgi:predicted short-subunit dehydrogenase-like oxidoreductase (DUF2520 family)